MEILFFYSLIFILVTIQTIIGVGVLVLGTPLLLIFNYGIIEIMNMLLPISILTSLLNYIYLKYNKKNLKINLDQNIKRAFVFIFLPGISIGLILTKALHQFINFEVLVSFVIFLSLIINWKFKKKIDFLPLYLKKFIIIFIGMVHGLTNSGGTLLTIFFTSLNKDKKNQSRYSITFYYLILVLAQYLIFIIIFDKEIFLDHFFQIISIVISALFLGNILIKKISEIFFQRTIEILALFSAIFLLINN